MSDLSPDDAPLAAWPRCVGHLRHGPDVAPVVCAVACDRTGEITLTLEPVPYTAESQWLRRRAFGDAGDGGGATVAFVGAELVAEDETRLTSSQVYFTSVGTTSAAGGFALTLAARATSLTARPASLSASPPVAPQIPAHVAGEPAQELAQPPAQQPARRLVQVRYRTTAMRMFMGAACALPDGKIAIGGSLTVEDYDALDGAVQLDRDAPAHWSPGAWDAAAGATLEASPESVEASHDEAADAPGPGRPREKGDIGDAAYVDAAAWMAECDARVEAVLLVFSLGLGHRIAWRVRELFVDGAYRGAYFRSTLRAREPGEGLFSGLDAQPVLALAVERFTPAVDAATGIGVAMAWLAAWSSYADLRLLGAATALEHLVRRWDAAPGAVVPATTFRAHVRPALEAALDDPGLAARVAADLTASGTPAADADGAAADALALFRRKVGTLNGAAFRNRAAAMLRHYDVPLDDLPVGVEALIQTRNTVVHAGQRGAGGTEVQITRDAGLLREVARRLVLAILGYDGQFTSHVRGPEWRSFRPRAAPDAPQG